MLFAIGPVGLPIRLFIEAASIARAERQARSGETVVIAAERRPGRITPDLDIEHMQEGEG